MATIERFEDILCFKKSRELTRAVYAALRTCRDRGFTDQIQRASVSIMSNIAEGFENGTRDMFVRYLYIAKGSAGEVRAQLYVAYDVGYVDIETFKRLKFQAEECSKLLSALIRGVKSSEYAGLQRKREPTKRTKAAMDFERESVAMLARELPSVWGPEYERRYGKGSR